ncbi:hypothetical protein K461DRAFT_134568 [Myriangium duriaei CBS 260.36]|uniref:Uncharacterized protein n=1 Tax=Myriangium duriaei CBS 260.36 TaxID=1168546 RepID=A0A9P4J626_9PEZI|nr:hypothetical protein K461DRAFT_134568 [Myriangium duriaei CBS 260.36]
MPGLVMAGNNSRPGPPTSNPPPLSFVTATSLSDFKKKDTMRQVRRAVMQTYLNKAENDPNSTDVRVTRKRTGSRNKKATSPTTPPEASKPSSSSDTSSQSKRKDSRIDATPQPVIDPPESYPTPGASSESSRAHSIRSLHVLEETHGPPVVPRSTPTAASSIASTTRFDTVEPDDVLDSDTALVQRRCVAERQAFDVAFGRPYGLHLREIVPDPFAACQPLNNPDLNIELLKFNCTTYFGSRAMGKDWVPLLLTNPASFLASLCVSAPYSDIMAMSQPGTVLSDRDRRQTLEILDVVPRMLNQSLADPVEGYSDANIAAVLQLLCGQISTNQNSMAPVHQACLKHMVMQRGGLEHIGTAIPIHVSITDMEANFLRNEPADPMYLKFARNYVEENNEVKALTAESPIFSRDPHMKAVKSSKRCSAPTHELIMYARQLTDKYLQLGQLRSRKDVQFGPAMYVNDSAEDELQSSIYKLVLGIHDMPAYTTLGHQGYNDAYYETVRLTSLLYAHAIWHDVPFHQAPHVQCDFSHGTDCKATPEMIQQVVIKTNLGEGAWNRLGGVLYWVFLVAGAACHQEIKTAWSDQDINSSMPHGHGQRPYGVSTTSSSSASSTPQLQIRSGSAPVQSQPSTMANLTLRQQHPPRGSSPEQPARLFQQYLSEQHLNLAKTMTPSSFTSSQPGSRNNSPLAMGQFTVPTSAPTTSAQYQPTIASPTPPSPPTDPSINKLGKRVRTSSPQPMNHNPLLRANMAPPVPKTKEEQDKFFVRNFLVANAVRNSILHRFEHTTAMASSIIRMGEVRDCLARRGR